MTFRHWYLVSVNIRPLRPIPKGLCNARCVIRLRRNQIPNKTLSFSLCHLCVLEARADLLPRVSTSFDLQTRRVQFLANSQTNSIPIWSPHFCYNGDRIRWSPTGEVTTATTPYDLFFYVIWQHHILIDISNQNVSCVSVFLLYFFLTILYFNLSSFNERWQISFSIF